MNNLDLIVEKVLERIEKTKHIPIEVSARHVHLCREHLDYLFGEGYKLEKTRELSQPKQYICKERVSIIGPKGLLQNVAILGPDRAMTQVEISYTDSIALGINAPFRHSGDLQGSETVFIRYGRKIIEARNSTIVAKRHIHMTPKEGLYFGIKDKEIVRVKIQSDRPLIFDDVLIRITEKSMLAMHIDYDEANACGYREGVLGEII